MSSRIELIVAVIDKRRSPSTKLGEQQPFMTNSTATKLGLHWSYKQHKQLRQLALYYLPVISR